MILTCSGFTVKKGIVVNPWMVCLILLVNWISPTVEGQNWDQFRGPNGQGFIDGVFSDKPLTQNGISWRVEIGSGHSSPVILNNLLLLTTFEDDLFQVKCLDRHNGQEQWSWKTKPIKIEKGHRNGSPAASSLALSKDGRIVAYSGSFGLVCLNEKGEELWRKNLPTPITQHGAGTSPVVHGNRVVLCIDQDVDSYLLCLDLASGDEVWRTPRSGFRRGFASPLIWEDKNGYPNVFMVGTLRAVNYIIFDGSELWSVSGLPNEVCATPVYSDGMIYCAAWTNGAGVSRIPDFSELLQLGDNDNDGKLTRQESPTGSPARMHFPYVDANKDGFISMNEYESLARIFRESKNTLMALNVSNPLVGTAPEISWKYSRGLPYVPSPLAYRNHLYIIKNGGMVSCFDKRSGEVHYAQERLNAVGDYYASPVAIGNRVVFISQPGVLTEVSTDSEFKILSRWEIGQNVFATPAITPEFVYLRTISDLIALDI